MAGTELASGILSDSAGVADAHVTWLSVGAKCSAEQDEWLTAALHGHQTTKHSKYAVFCVTQVLLLTICICMSKQSMS